MKLNNEGKIYIKNLIDYENLLKNNYSNIEQDIIKSPLVYIEDLNYFIYDDTKVFYRKVPALAGVRFLFALKLLQAINNKYIPIFNKQKELLYTEQEFLEYRKKMAGIKEYNNENFPISDNLKFSGIDTYLSLIDSNILEVHKRREVITKEFTRIMSELGLTTTIGNNSGGDIELVETGSTIRGTNLPINNGNFDFDFTVRINPDKVWLIKEALETKFSATRHITKTSAYKVRLLGVKIPGLNELIDLDFSLTPQKEKYLATEEVISEQLNNIKMQDEEKYHLVLANIMYAKSYLKKIGAYKPSRGILEGDRQYGGISGVGIEEWILQNGGSFIDASREFLSHAEGKEFIDFQKEYTIMDLGKNHVEVSKKNFPYDNFIMKNMRYKGYELMKQSLKQFLETIDLENKENKKSI